MAFFNCPDDAGTYINLIKKGMPLNADPQKIVDDEVSIADILKPFEGGFYESGRR
jgi:hypothetical protein